MQHKGTVFLETDRLILRRFDTEDAYAAFNNCPSDTEATEFLRCDTHKDVFETECIFKKFIKAYDKAGFNNKGIVDAYIFNFK